MGSFRRQLAVWFSLTASPAMAQVCATQRPDWTAADGAATALGEVLQFLVWGGGGVLIAALVAGLYFRKSIVLNGVLLVALIMAVPYLWPLNPIAQRQAINEGCMGETTLVIGLLGLIWVLAAGGALFRRKKAAP